MFRAERELVQSLNLGGAVPTTNHVVRIVQAHTVTIDDTSAVAYTIAVDGKLAFAPTLNTHLKVTNLEVMAGPMAMGTRGVLEVGTAAAPIAANVTTRLPMRIPARKSPSTD